MARLTRAAEKEKRKQVDALIEMYGLQTEYAVYISPGTVESEAARRKIDANRQYIWERYKELGIEYKNGLWVKRL